MERNRATTAIRCLEIALHPNTSDHEIIAAVNGFRRTAGGMPLREICLQFAGTGYDGLGPVADHAKLSAKLDRLNRENFDLRRKLEAEENNQVATADRLHEATQLIRELSEELLAAQRQASAAMQRFAELRSAHAEILERVQRENSDLRRALEQARHAATGLEPRRTPPFRKFLSAALQGADPAEAARARHPAAFDAGRESGGSASFGSGMHAPWTA